MSDAITLDVLSSSPVQLDVGDADPIAREEIAELAERVEAIEADYVTSEDVMDALGGEAPALVSGSSRAMLGDAETASWMERTTAADGAALIEAVRGNTVVESGSLLPVRMEGVETVAADESWSSQRTIPAATYFPDGMRSAGTVHDELRADAAVTRVGAVDLGTLTWTYASNHRYYSDDIAGVALLPANTAIMPYITAAKYRIAPATISLDTNTDVLTILVDSSPGRLIMYAESADAPKPAGLLFYAVKTPTTTPIDPPLPMSYRTGKGGTERVMVASGTTSAPPIFVTRYPLDPADLAASIAPVDGPTAKTNHQVGDLIMLGFTLCKATQVIVTGETIEIGTNVTRTSVAAELAALSQ